MNPVGTLLWFQNKQTQQLRPFYSVLQHHRPPSKGSGSSVCVIICEDPLVCSICEDHCLAASGNSYHKCTTWIVPLTRPLDIESGPYCLRHATFYRPLPHRETVRSTKSSPLTQQTAIGDANKPTRTKTRIRVIQAAITKRLTLRKHRIKSKSRVLIVNLLWNITWVQPLIFYVEQSYLFI